MMLNRDVFVDGVLARSQSLSLSLSLSLPRCHPQWRGLRRGFCPLPCPFPCPSRGSAFRALRRSSHGAPVVARAAATAASRQRLGDYPHYCHYPHQYYYHHHYHCHYYHHHHHHRRCPWGLGWGWGWGVSDRGGPGGRVARPNRPEPPRRDKGIEWGG